MRLMMSQSVPPRLAPHLINVNSGVRVAADFMFVNKCNCNKLPKYGVIINCDYVVFLTAKNSDTTCEVNVQKIPIMKK
jgi:hypothetical protein